MKFGEFLELVGELPWFDFAMALQLTGEPLEHLRVRLYEWRKAGKLLPLRRGMYTLADPYRRGDFHPAQLSNHLYTPSYLSLNWALSFYGLIPEKSVLYTSVSPRVPRRFQNAFGNYRYFNVKQKRFFGSRTVRLDGHSVQVAEPEKALLDLWHLQSGEWTGARMREMRFQNMDQVDSGRLRDYAGRFDSPRLVLAVDAWEQLCDEGEEGTVIL